MTMLQSARWRLLMPFLYPPRRTWHVRSLHLQPSGQKHARKSMAVHRQEASNKAANRDNVRGDLGLLPGTFVKPARAHRPSIFRETRKRMDLEWYWIKQKWVSISGMFFYKFFSKKGKPRPKLDRRKIGPMAQVMYERMYTALANGDISSIKSTCLDGITASLRRRIGSRQPDEKVVWTLHRYIGRPRIVSTRIVALPEIDASALYQVVVRIRSLQRLQRSLKGQNGDETVIEDIKDQQNEVVEYVVMQKMMLSGNEGSWKLWGMTEETDPKEVLYDRRSKSKAASPAIAR